MKTLFISLAPDSSPYTYTYTYCLSTSYNKPRPQIKMARQLIQKQFVSIHNRIGYARKISPPVVRAAHY